MHHRRRTDAGGLGLRRDLLAGDGEDEIGMGVGQELLDGAFSGTAAEQAAVHERLEAGVDLIGVAGGGVEKAIDAAAKVWAATELPVHEVYQMVVLARTDGEVSTIVLADRAGEMFLATCPVN